MRIDPLGGGECPPATVVVDAVKDGEEGMPLRLDYVKPCLWTRNLDRSFSTTLSRFSLRVGNVRTECHAATVDSENGSPVARLHFNCCAIRDGSSLTIETDPDLPVSYLRVVDAKIPGLTRHPDAHPCLEEGTLTASLDTIGQVQFGMEKIHLQIGREEPDPDAAGLRVKDLPDAVKRGDRPLTFDNVVYRLIVQRARDRDLAPNAIDLDVLKLKEVKLESLTVRVSQ